MSSLAIRQQIAKAEQRRAPRFPVKIPVTLRTVSGNRKCRIANISDLGAKLEMPDPPGEGISACIICGSDEIYCRIIWSDENACGVEFERALGEARLIEMVGEQSEPNGPVANVGNIQMGRKRGQLVSGG